ncbi:hypothetical protein V5799_007225 [Amblyomma americanum]|uniref:Fibronectin type-III domain-containing protein n=1 Tax=Amblyomma americanum TaxID=6943 RepID=A0AAQ4DU54_AMBAM
MSVVCLALLLVLLDTTVSQEPRFISVLSSEQRNVVVNIVGPLSWNGDPVGFHVIWKATSEHYGPRGELDIPLTRDVNAVNATLQLPEGMVYRIFLSCVVTDASGAKVRGPVLEVEENVPVVGYDVWAYAVDSAQAVVSWRASKSVEIFKVTVYIDEGRDDFRVFSSKTFDGKHTTTTQSFLVTDLQAWGYYEVRLEGCSVENCSKAVKTALRTPPQVIPKPSISRAEATATSSFKLAWLFPQSDVRLFNGFRVWYCPINVAGCVLVYTNERKVNLTGLKPDSTVRIEVQAVFIDTAGKEVLGREATSSVKTWSNLPQVYIEKGLNIQDDVSTCFIYWRCTNSSVDYLEYGSTVAQTSGYVRVTHRDKSLDYASLRCCNSYGCGEGRTILVGSPVTGPFSITGVTVTAKGRTALLQWNHSGPRSYSGVEVRWTCKGDKAVQYNRERLAGPYKAVGMKKIQIDDLPTDARDCQFYVSPFEFSDKSRHCGFPVHATVR